MRTARLFLYLVGAALALSCRVEAAPDITLQDAVERAWQRLPAARTLEARQQEAAVARASAGSWLASSPSLGLSQRRDQGAPERAGRETEITVSSPVWLPAQKAARVALAARSGDEASARLHAMRLQVAGIVRDRMWEAAAAQVGFEEKQYHLAHLEGLRDEVQRRVQAGDLARSDALLAEQEVLAARIEVGNARSAASEALARYRVVTNLDRLPPLTPEALTEGGAPADPRLAAAQAAERRARAELRLATASRPGQPTVSVAVRQEDERLLREPVNSIAIAVQIPIGSTPGQRGIEAQAQTALATASAEAVETQAQTEADIGVARERLAQARTGLELATARAAVLHEHTRLFERAFRAGERGLADLLRSQALTHEADVAVAQHRVALGHAHARLNQALGILP